MPGVTQNDKRTALKTNLSTWLLRHHPGEVKKVSTSIVLIADPHISVPYGEAHGYINFKTGETGNSINYLMRFLGYSYPDAVRALLDAGEPVWNPSEGERVDEALASEMALPEPNRNGQPHAYAYLKSRGLSPDVIKRLVSEKLLYEDAVHFNLVFTTPARDYAEIRGTASYAERRCKKCRECADYECSQHDICKKLETCERFKKDVFHQTFRKNRSGYWYFLPAGRETPVRYVFVCEAAIDAVSLYELHRLYGKILPAAYVSIGGAANQKAIDALTEKFGSRVYIATDRDAAGEEVRSRNPELLTIRPSGKDWNDDLRTTRKERSV